MFVIFMNNEQCTTESSNFKFKKNQKMEIKVLGTGCRKCKALEQSIRKAVEQKGINATITKVEDLREIMKYGVMTTPALVINGRVVLLKGKTPSVEELADLLSMEINH